MLKEKLDKFEKEKNEKNYIKLVKCLDKHSKYMRKKDKTYYCILTDDEGVLIYNSKKVNIWKKYIKGKITYNNVEESNIISKTEQNKLVIGKHYVSLKIGSSFAQFAKSPLGIALWTFLGAAGIYYFFGDYILAYVRDRQKGEYIEIAKNALDIGDKGFDEPLEEILNISKEELSQNEFRINLLLGKDKTEIPENLRERTDIFKNVKQFAYEFNGKKYAVSMNEENYEAIKTLYTDKNISKIGILNSDGSTTMFENKSSNTNLISFERVSKLYNII